MRREAGSVGLCVRAVRQQPWVTFRSALVLSAVAGVYLVDDALERRRDAVEKVDSHWTFDHLMRTAIRRDRASGRVSL
jgi:hypothetical protein